MFPGNMGSHSARSGFMGAVGRCGVSGSGIQCVGSPSPRRLIGPEYEDQCASIPERRHPTPNSNLLTVKSVGPEAAT
jgi:hypothetical protein